MSKIEPHITVLICTRDRPLELARALRSISALDYPSFDVLIVDSAPRHAHARDAAASWGAAYIFEPNPGLSRARNRGCRVARGEIIAMMDDDAVAEAGWLKGLGREFDDPLLMAVAGRIKNFEPETDEARLFGELFTADLGSTRRIIDQSDPLWLERTCFGGVGNGANLVFRRTAFDIWPGFCEELGVGARIGGGEEHHAFFSLVALGYRVAYLPDAAVSHPCPTNYKEFQDRYFYSLSAQVGYMAFLLAQQPRYRLRLSKYFLQGVFRVRRTWRPVQVPRQFRMSLLKTIASFILGLKNAISTLNSVRLKSQ